MPGTLARHYAAQGGQAVLMGKPAPVIYREALAMLQLPAEQVPPRWPPCWDACCSRHLRAGIAAASLTLPFSMCCNPANGPPALSNHPPP